MPDLFESSAMFDAIKDGLGEKGVLTYFNNILMGCQSDEFIFSPDINGYSLIFMLPVQFSAEEWSEAVMSHKNTSKMFAFLALDFTPPQTQVISTQLPVRTGSMTYGTEVNMSGEISITYLDTDELEVFEYHKVWVSYIEAITRGNISPNKKFFEKESEYFGIVDYITSAYVVRFKMNGDIVYVGKATGIFPLNLPDKEVIGRRDSNELTVLPINYTCVLYKQQVKGKSSPVDNWILEEFTNECLKRYSE